MPGSSNSQGPCWNIGLVFEYGRILETCAEGYGDVEDIWRVFVFVWVAQGRDVYLLTHRETALPWSDEVISQLKYLLLRL